jgi:hypothetical protein
MNLTKNTELGLDQAVFRNRRRDRILLWATVLGLVVILNLIVGFSRMSSVSASASRFADALVSQTHSAQITPSAASAYDWLIGDWEADVYDYENGEKRVSKGEWHFSWVLEGRAIQDVWIVPKLGDRNARTPANHNRYGTTIRIFDPKIEAWRVFWFNPVTQDRTELIGRKVGKAIVQQSVNDDSFTRWIFDDIKPNSFVWRGEFSNDGGKTWQLDAEFHARRIANR